VFVKSILRVQIRRKNSARGATRAGGADGFYAPGLPGEDRFAMTSEALPESVTPESLTLVLRRSLWTCPLAAPAPR